MTDKITLPEELRDPYFCEDESDFFKLFFAHGKSLCESEEDFRMFTIGIKIMMHEYLALILSGKIKPFLMHPEIVKQEMPGFKEVMHNINEELTKAGVPMVETEEGKMKLDMETIFKDIEGRKWK